MKKLGLLLGVFGILFMLVACGSSSEMTNYIEENEEELLTIFESMELGAVELSTAGDDELVVTIETTQDEYDLLTEIRAIFDIEETSEVFQMFILEQYTGLMQDLAFIIADETELDQVTIRIIVMLEERELVNETFTWAE